MNEQANERQGEIEKERERLHHDVVERERLREEERRLERRIDEERAEVERLERENREHEVVVNGEKKTVKGSRITFEQLVRLAFPHTLAGPNVSYTVTFRLGADKEHPEGSLVAGGTVRIKDGTRFNVRATDKS